jgi:glycosyltransferase involved in cell wall biosynthesis
MTLWNRLIWIREGLVTRLIVLMHDSPVQNTPRKLGFSYDVSVIFAFRNRVDHISRALASLHNLKDLRLQVIAIDGESSDGSFKLVKSFSPTLLLQREPNGVYDAWNFALKLCTAPHTIFLNSDDEILDGMHMLIKLAQSSKSAITAGSALMTETRCSTAVMEKISWPANLNSLSIIRGPLPFNSAVYSTGSLRKCGPFPAQMSYLGDRAMISQLLRNGSSFEMVPTIDSYKYHVVNDSLTMNGNYVPISQDLIEWSRKTSYPQSVILRVYSLIAKFRYFFGSNWVASTSRLLLLKFTKR